MNIPARVLEFLKSNRNCAVESFGTFSLKNSGAKLDEDSKTLLPPSQKISFTPDFQTADGGFVKFLSENNHLDEISVRSQLKIQTDYWKNKIKAGESFEVNPLGRFEISENEFHFSGSRIASETPDFYGLEEINISEIKGRNFQNSSTENNKESYKTKFNFWWLLLIAVPVAALAYFAMTNPEMIFGKKSTLETPKKNAVPAVKIDSLKKDSLQNSAILDSVKKDSLPVATPVIAKKKSPKTYYKKKWKPKKRRTH